MPSMSPPKPIAMLNNATRESITNALASDVNEVRLIAKGAHRSASCLRDRTLLTFDM